MKEVTFNGTIFPICINLTLTNFKSSNFHPTVFTLYTDHLKLVRISRVHTLPVFAPRGPPTIKGCAELQNNVVVLIVLGDLFTLPFQSHFRSFFFSLTKTHDTTSSIRNVLRGVRNLFAPEPSDIHAR